MKKQEIEKNLIFLFIRGSQAYGTNTPESDEDFGGICMPSKRVLYGLDKFEGEENWTDEQGNKIDKSIYVLSKAIRLMCENNPNALDYLYTPERVIQLMTPQWQRIVDIRDQFLCIKAKYSFQGYAHAQLKRLETHRGYLLNPPIKKPERADYGLPEKSIFPETQCESISRISTDFVAEKDRDAFYNEMAQMINREGALVFKKYIDPNYYLFAIEDFKKVQKQFLHMISSISGRYLKDEIAEMAQNELRYISSRFNWNRYQQWKKSRNKNRAVMEAKVGYDCYSYDTEFLTENGWKHFDNINDMEKLATLTPKTHKIEYHTPIEKFDGIFNGNLFHFYHTDTLVTPNHNMYVQKVERNNKKEYNWEFIEASHLGDCFNTLKIINPKINTMKKCKEFEKKNLNISLNNYLKIMGWYISDGTCLFRDKKVKVVRISQSKLNSGLTQSITKLRLNSNINCNAYTYPPRKNKKLNENMWDFPRNISEEIYNDCGHGSKLKRIPRWVFKLTRKQLSFILKALLQGDGYKRNHQDNTYIYYTSNEHLANDIQELSFLCGYETSKWGKYESTGFNNETGMYQIHINTSPNVKRQNVRCRNIQKVNVKNHRIVCFTVKNHILITRRNGKISIHGNSKHASHLRRLENMSYEITTGQGVLVDRTHIDRDYFMTILRGEMPFEQLQQDSNDINKKTDAAYKDCKLPNKPNIKLIQETMVELLDEHIYKMNN